MRQVSGFPLSVDGPKIGLTVDLKISYFIKFEMELNKLLCNKPPSSQKRTTFLTPPFLMVELSWAILTYSGIHQCFHQKLVTFVVNVR